MLTSCIKFFNGDDCCSEMVLVVGPTLRMAEIVGESCPQSMLGIYIQIILGPSQTSETTRMLQYLGIAASLISICKGTSDWWVRSKSLTFDEEPTFVETLKAALF